MMPRRASGQGPADESGAGAEVNAVVSYNLGAIRRRRGLTQQELADRLGRLTGRLLSAVSICHMERGFAPGRRRRFDAHELYLLSVILDVPIAFFFVPPPSGVGPAQLADTGRPLADLYAAVLGRDAQLVELDDRLGEVRLDGSRATDAAVGAVYGAGRDWIGEFRAWRRTRLLEAKREYGYRLEELGGLLADMADAVGAVGPRTYLGTQTPETDGPAAALFGPRSRPTPVGHDERHSGRTAANVREA